MSFCRITVMTKQCNFISMSDKLSKKVGLLHYSCKLASLLSTSVNIRQTIQTLSEQVIPENLCALLTPSFHSSHKTHWLIFKQYFNILSQASSTQQTIMKNNFHLWLWLWHQPCEEREAQHCTSLHRWGIPGSLGGIPDVAAAGISEREHFPTCTLRADISGSYRKPTSCQQECCKALTTPHTCGMCEGGAQLSGHLTSSTKSCFHRGSLAWQEKSTHHRVKYLFHCM